MRRVESPVEEQRGANAVREQPRGVPLARPWAGLALGAAGVVGLCLITPFNDYRLKNTYLYGNHLPIGGLFLFSLLALLYNPLARRFCRRLALGTSDLLVFWAMVTTGAGLASSGLWRYLGPGVVAPAYFANSGAPWLPEFDNAPSWLLLSHDPQSPLVLWFYQGLPFGKSTPWGAWMPVLAGWGIGFLFIALFSLSVSSLFRKQWVERERLTYPLVQLPLQIAVDSAGPGVLARSGALWAGCATVMVLHGASTLHHFMPSVPQLLDSFDIRAVQQVAPWNALGLPLLEIFLAVIGVIFLLPADVAFSLWFTYVALHLVRVIRAAMGYDALMHGPLDQESAMGAGAFLVIAAWLVWLARDHLALAWRGFLRPARVDDAAELMSYRTAVSLTLISLVGLVAWMRLAGIGWVLAVLLVLLSAVILLVLSRIIAESGLLFIQSPFIPTDLLAFWGTHNISAPVASTTLLTEVIFIHDPREQIMPAIANAEALVPGIGGRPRFLAGALALALALGYFSGFAGYVWTAYHFGAVTMDPYGTDSAPHWSLDRALEYANSPLSPSYGDMGALALGGVLTVGMAVLRARLVWWPLGPIGLAMASTYAMDRIYFSVFLGWLFKAGIVRYGGLNLYRKVVPFFLGLILGEGLFGGLAALWGLCFGVSAPPFLPD
jgi:hypothetical protein